MMQGGKDRRQRGRTGFEGEERNSMQGKITQGRGTDKTKTQNKTSTRQDKHKTRRTQDKHKTRKENIGRISVGDETISQDRRHTYVSVRRKGKDKEEGGKRQTYLRREIR
jgi:hypothetical protein